MDAKGGCGFCWGEKLAGAVKALCAATRSTDNAALLARTDAIETLRSLGFTQEQVVHARARALDQHPAREIVDWLLSAAEVRSEVAA